MKKVQTKKQGKINIKDVIFVAVIMITCFCIFCLVKGNAPAIFGYRILHVVSGSMEPAIESGSYIIIKEVETTEIKVGDIITFVSEEPAIMGMYNTHRVYDICKDTYTGETLYVTKGDAYEEPDAYAVTEKQIVGRLTKILPYGQVINKVMTTLSNNYVYFGVVIVPLVICLVSYLVQFSEALFQRNDDDEELEEYQKEDLEEK